MPIAQNHLPDDINAMKSRVAEKVARNKQLQVDKQSVVQKNEQLQARAPGRTKGANDE